MKKLIDLSVGDKAWYIHNGEDYVPRRVTISSISYSDEYTCITFKHDWNIDRETTIHVSNTWLESKSLFEINSYNTLFSDSACMIKRFRQTKKQRVNWYYDQLEYFQENDIPPDSDGNLRENYIELLTQNILKHEHRYREMLKEVRRIEKG